MSTTRNERKLNIVNFLKADTGYYLLEKVTNEGDTLSIFKHCIIGWAVDYDERHEIVVTYPITLEAMITENLPILRPDGVVESPLDTFWSSLDEWLEWEKIKGAENV